MCKDVHCSVICQTEDCKQQKENDKINYRTYTREIYFIYSFIYGPATVFQKGFEVVHMIIYYVTMKNYV